MQLSILFGLADSLRWPFNGWARLMRLLLMKHCLERAQGGPYGFLSCNL